MPSWTKLLRRPELIEGLYERPPCLDDFALSEVSFEDADNACDLGGTLAQFPDFPRPGWEDDANRAGMRLRLEGLGTFELEGWAFENIVDLSIEQIRAGGIRVIADGEAVFFRAVCDSLHVANIFAYHEVDGQ